MARRSKTQPPERDLPGQKSLFRDKVRAPVSITLTREHHRKAKIAMRRLGLTRADLIGLLIDQYADKVQLPE
ncbi:MAG: hypothetical protein Q7J25_12255 [Vicinamibacterales bacterium]|nr:hypothetical protein [Vicinamibacterales bacterium]